MKEPKRNDTLKFSILAALMAALTAIGAYISIPIKPVPFVLANLFVLLSGLLLGPWWGAASMLLYLLLGAIGLPVFAGGTAGAAKLVGVTGGFLFGYVLAAFIVGLVVSFSKRSFGRDLFALLLGAISIYALGLPWLKVTANIETWSALFTMNMWYMIGDVVKALIAALIAQALYISINPLLPKVGRR